MDININKSVDTLRMYFKKHKADSYPITEHPLEKEDEHTKGIYITMLCTIMYNDGAPREEQRLFIERLIKGIGLSEDIQSYIKKAMEIDDKFAKEFVDTFKNSHLKYNFMVDALILVSSVGTPGKKDIEFISEICDILSINKDDVRFYSDVVLGIVNQDSNKSIVSSNINLTIEKINAFKCYYKEFCSGYLINNYDTLYLYTEKKTELNFKKFGMEGDIISFNKRIVVFENYIINLDNLKLEFTDCEEVRFINCDFNGQEIEFRNCKNIIIEECKFKKFYGGTINLSDCYSICIKKSYFTECSDYINKEKRGGIICSKNLKKADIIGCEFYNCSAIKSNTSSWGLDPSYCSVIFYTEVGCIINLKENKFNSCRSIGINSENIVLIGGFDSRICNYKDNKVINSDCELISGVILEYPSRRNLFGKR